MTEKRKPGLVKSFINFVMIVPTLFSFVSNVISLVGWEARIAGRNIVKIIVLSLLLFAVLISAWLCVLVLLVVAILTYLHWSLIIALSAVIGLNIFILLILGLLAMKYQRQISFENTQNLIHHLKDVR